MISFYKWKKHAVFIMLGFIPLLLFLMVFFPTLKFYTIQGIRFMYIDPFYLVISIVAAAVSVLIIMLMGNRWLHHAFTSMLEGKGLITLILDSTGLIGSFNVKINAPKMIANLGKNLPEIDDIYDTDMMHRLIIPKDAPMGEGAYYEKDDKGNIKLTGETAKILVLPNEDEKYDSLFSFENRPVFIYNKVMRKFLSRDALAKYEKDIEIKHNALNILNKVQDTDKSFRDFGRYAGEISKPKKPGLFGSGLMRWLIIGAIIALIIFVVILFVPGFLNAGANLGP